MTINYVAIRVRGGAMRTRNGVSGRPKMTFRIFGHLRNAEIGKSGLWQAKGPQAALPKGITDHHERALGGEALPPTVGKGPAL